MTNKDQEEEIYGYFKFNGQDIPVNDSFITYCIIGVIIVIAGIAGGIYGISHLINSNIESATNKLQSEKSSIERQISQAQGESEGNVDNIIAEISKNNISF